MLSMELPADEVLQAQRWTPAPLLNPAAKPGSHAENLAAWSPSVYTCIIVSSREMALPALQKAWAELTGFAEKMTTGE